MLPPNVIGSIDNLTRNGILDYGTAAYVADVRPNRYGYLMNSNPMNPNPYSTPFDSFSYANNPFGNYYVRRRFWQKIGNIALLLGVTYLGGKVFLRSAQGVKALGKNKAVAGAAETAENSARGGIRNFFNKLFKKAPAGGTAAGTAEAGAAATTATAGTAATGAKTGLSKLFSKIKTLFTKAGEDITGMTKRIFKNGKFRPSF